MTKPTLLVLAAAAVANARYLSNDEIVAMYGRRTIAEPIHLKHRMPGFQANQTLREAAAAVVRPDGSKGFFVGSADAYAHLTQDATFRQLALTEFNLVTAENECKFGPTEPEQGQYTLDQCTYVTGTMLNASGVVRGHNTVWGQQNPNWLENGNFNGQQLQGFMEDHIGKVMGNYAGTFYCWDVVNEPVCDSGQPGCPNASVILKPTVWYPKLANYIPLALQAARAADGKAKLFINDYGAEDMGAKSNRVYALAQELKTAGVPLDGIGLQMHISTQGGPNPADVSANIARLGALGLEVHITEMDVKCPSPCDQNAQAKVYGDILQACLNNTNCKSFETWGITDKYSWLPDSDSPLLWDNNYNKKPAYYEVLATLQAAAAK